MKIVKYLAIGLGSLIALLLIVAAFMPTDMAVTKEITINKPKAEIFSYIKLLKNQDNFSKWAKMDPNMTKTYRGTDATVGFVSAWDSKKDDVGTGEQEIKRIEEGKRIDYELRFIKPFESVSTAFLETEEVSPTQTKVKWGYNGKMNYPMNIMMAFMDIEEMLGDDFSTGLSNLKAIMEK
jgi:uncharacterized protein YndB with AHSA1/START domain